MHQLVDVINSNIQNKNVLNNAEATAVSNIPSKISKKMFSPTLFLQYEKDEYESHDNDNSYKKIPAPNTYGINTISGKGNVEYVIIRCLIIRKDDVIPCSENYSYNDCILWPYIVHDMEIISKLICW